MPGWPIFSRLLLIFLILAHSSLFAEPWFGSRFAQNCAACHAPGRSNLPAADRRCTLSCQGCHINPNGGGIRSEYGKWTSQRWLRSYMMETVGHKAGPAPYEQQVYAKKSTTESRKTPHRSGGEANRYPAKSAPQLVTANESHQRTKAFDRHHVPEKTGENLSEFLQSIPVDDPYWERRQNPVVGGVDLRFQYFKPLEPKQEKGRFFAMTGDFGLGLRPVSNLHKLQVVYESRFLGQISGPPLDEQISQAQTRSLYALVDDLPWNSFVMGGYYQPLFANDAADHNKLSRKFVAASLTGNSRGAYRLLYKAFSVGAAPNVPYFNVHHIAKRIDDSNPDDRTQGFAANAGLRFVSLGASLQYSLWSTKDRSPEFRDTRIMMQALHLNSTLGQDRLFLGWEGILSEVERDRDFYRAWVSSVEMRWRFYREFYLTGEWAVANSDENLEEGSAKQQKYGIQAFIWSGIAWHGAYVINDFRTSGRERPSQHYFSSQIHIYY
ncbi:MAG: hypothetical protein ACOH5I_06910 [Oligoflexus sp.]